jgi:homoserine acetyltransferase
MDLFDISDGFDNMVDALSTIRSPVLIMGAQTDILFPVKQQRELAKLLKEAGNGSVSYFEMDSLYG